MPSLMIPTKVSRENSQEILSIYKVCYRVLFSSKGYKKHVMLEQVWQFQFQLPAGFSTSFYEFLKRCSI